MHASPDDLAELLLAVVRELRPGPDAFRVAAEQELSFSGLRTLMVLDHGGPLTVGALAGALALSQPAASRTVDALLRAGLVQRAEDPEDRRAKRVALTPSGDAFVARFVAGRREAARALVARLSDDQQAALHAALVPVLEDRPEALAR